MSGTAASPRRPVRRRVLALGFDGADLRIVREHAGSLPVLRDLLARGRILEPCSPRGLSGAVWPTFSAGCPPGEHGIYQHLVWDAARMALRTISPDDYPRPPFWAELDRRGLRVVVVDVPYSFPVGLARGIEIHDWATHGQTQPTVCNRPEIARRVRRLGSPMGRETPIEKTAAQLRRAHRGILASAALKGGLLAELASRTEWDFFLAIFGETHRGGHLFYGLDDGSALREVYAAVDRSIGEILGGIDLEETAIVLFSVHGMERDHAQRGIVRPLLERLNRSFVVEAIGAPARAHRMRPSLLGPLRARIPPALQHAVATAAPDALRRWVVNREVVDGVDWRAMPGFALRTDIRSELRLNLVGREAAGLLDRGSDLHRRYVDLVRDSFRDLRDADTGAALVSEVLSIPDRFPGPFVDALPDLVVEWRPEPPARAIRSTRFGTFPLGRAAPRGGDHRDRGFAIVAGAGASDATGPLEGTHDFARFLVSCLGLDPAARS